MRLLHGEKVISDNVRVADDTLSRMVGLLNCKKLDTGESLLIEPCNSIHTFFMKFNIDVLFLDKNFKVVKVFRDLPPWRITRPYFSVKRVVEANADTFDEVKPGDQLELRDV
tara:strand:+ start:5630 stop:5965 length:336 start_codon:yes stop_codon:yes gene_type:complete